MRPGSGRSALVSTKSPKYLLSTQGVCVWGGGGVCVSDLKKKRLENWPDFLFLHRVAVVVIGGTFSGGPK